MATQEFKALDEVTAPKHPTCRAAAMQWLNDFIHAWLLT